MNTKDNIIKKCEISYKEESIFYVSTEVFDLNKETIIMLHPAFSDYRIFVKQFEAFKDRYNIIAVDLIGHGLNNDLDPSITLADMTGIIEAILLKNNIKKVHLLGVSLGSLVAQGIADQRPKLVKSVTVVGGYSIHKANEEILKAQNKEKFKWIFMIIFAMNRFRNYVTKISTNTDLGQDLFKQGTLLFRRRSFRAMQGLDQYFRKSDDIMTYPLLLVVGSEDLDLAVNGAHTLHDLEPNSQLEIVKGAGHCVNIDAYERFNTIYSSFLEDLI